LPRTVVNVLVVDDNVESAFMMAEVLKRAGHQVRVAVGGNEAIRAAAAEAVDVILMDINLPDLDGFQAATRIKTLMPHVKVIGMSGMNIPQETQGDLLILDRRLYKPIRPEDLLHAVEEFFAAGPA